MTSFNAKFGDYLNSLASLQMKGGKNVGGPRWDLKLFVSKFKY